MKRIAVVFARCAAACVAAGVAAGVTASLAAGRTPDAIFTGVIRDNRCADGLCATQCPVRKTPLYTLQTETDGWRLSDQKTPARYLGRKVEISGHPGRGNTLKVVSMTLLDGASATSANPDK